MFIFRSVFRFTFSSRRSLRFPFLSFLPVRLPSCPFLSLNLSGRRVAPLGAQDVEGECCPKPSGKYEILIQKQKTHSVPPFPDLHRSSVPSCSLYRRAYGRSRRIAGRRTGVRGAVVLQLSMIAHHAPLEENEKGEPRHGSRATHGTRTG